MDTHTGKPTWTKTRPTTPGWYWQFDDSRLSKLEMVYVDEVGWAAYVADEIGVKVSDMSGWWQGPIEPVGEPGGE